VTYRVILNLGELNEYVIADHFKMDTIKDAVALMYQGCYFASIDFKHAYYSVAVEEKLRDYLAFEWNDGVYRFTALPQGLRSSPRLFMKLMKPPFAVLRGRGHTLLGYTDDTLFIGDSPEEVALAKRKQCINNLGSQKLKLLCLS
jgi:hypothetical protein